VITLTDEDAGALWDYFLQLEKELKILCTFYWDAQFGSTISTVEEFIKEGDE